MTWDGVNKRNDDKQDHDLLIRIDQNLENLIKIFHEHVLKDEDSFKKLEERANRLEKALWIAIGIILAVNFIIKFIK